MKLQGTATLHADRERVFAALTDPGVLSRCIPGCESLDLIGEDSYKMTVSAGVGAIRGRYDGQVTLTELVRPDGYVMNARGAGAAGTVDATCRIDLTDDGEQTQLAYSADATVGGPVAGVGQRMISAVAKRMAGQFFAAVDAELRGIAPVSTKPDRSVAYLERTDVHQGRTDSSWGDRNIHVDVRPFLVGGVAGAAIALLGVLVGSRLGKGR